MGLPVAFRPHLRFCSHRSPALVLRSDHSLHLPPVPPLGSCWSRPQEPEAGREEGRGRGEEGYREAGVPLELCAGVAQKPPLFLLRGGGWMLGPAPRDAGACIPTRSILPEGLCGLSILCWDL